MAGQWIQGGMVGLMVLGAVAYLLRKYLPRSRKAVAESKGCGSCSGCSDGGCH